MVQSDTARTRKDDDTARLARAERGLRAQLTTVLNEVRLLEKAARTAALSPEDAERLRALRSHESELHTQLAEGTAALRRVRESEA